MRDKRDIGGGNHSMGCLIPTLFFGLSILAFYQACNNPWLSSENARKRNRSYMSQPGAKMQSKVQEIEEEKVYDPAEQKRILEVSLILTKYSHQIEGNLFIQRVDEEIKEGLYEGYDMEYFHFHQFRRDVVKKLYEIFFDTYDYFTPEEQDLLLTTAQDDEFYTWNSKKKELAIYGYHLELLAEAFGEESRFFRDYKNAYIETRSLTKSIKSLLPESMRGVREYSFEAWEGFEKRTFSKKQRDILIEILFAEYYLL